MIVSLQTVNLTERLNIRASREALQVLLLLLLFLVFGLMLCDTALSLLYPLSPCRKNMKTKPAYNIVHQYR